MHWWEKGVECVIFMYNFIGFIKIMYNLMDLLPHVSKILTRPWYYVRVNTVHYKFQVLIWENNVIIAIIIRSSNDWHEKWCYNCITKHHVKQCSVILFCIKMLRCNDISNFLDFEVTNFCFIDEWNNEKYQLILWCKNLIIHRLFKLLIYKFRSSLMLWESIAGCICLGCHYWFWK